MKEDLSKIVVTGCSYAGKMALFSGEFDERIALTIAQESGGGGINAWRVADKRSGSVGIPTTSSDEIISRPNFAFKLIFKLFSIFR